MNTNHIDHEGFVSIPSFSINSDYKTAHFGKWGMGKVVEMFGYDVIDGATKNKDGNFISNKTNGNIF